MIVNKVNTWLAELYHIAIFRRLQIKTKSLLLIIRILDKDQFALACNWVKPQTQANY